MLRVKRISRRAGAWILVGLGCAVAWPARAGSSPGDDRVAIVRDTYGVPHITGGTEADVGFGLGYAQAEDHLEMLARRVLEARGEAARWFGPKELENDFAMRRIGNLAEARMRLNQLDATYRDVLSGFAAGANTYVARHRDGLPPWIPLFEPADFLATPRAASASAMFSPALVRALQRKYGPASLTPAVAEPSPIDDAPGSNALALSAAKSASGRPILLGNPHLRWSSLYWEAHVIQPGRLNFYGSTLVGLPWLRAGFNEHLGYVQTNNAPDLADVFALPLDPDRRNHYVFEGRSRALLDQEIAVEVLQPDGVVARQVRTFKVSHLGPVIHQDERSAFAYRSSALDAWRFFEGFWRLSHSRNLDDFRGVLARRLMPSSNFTYADAAGNILYFWNARLPRRREGTSYALDVPAETDRFIWRDLHKSSDLPFLLNPPGGYVQNANNPPWFVSKTDPLSPGAYPADIEPGELGLRPQLALQLIEAGGKLTVDDVRALKFSNRMLLAERVRDDLLAAAGRAAPSDDLREARDTLAAWDGTSSATATGAVLFQRFWELYRRALGEREPFAVRWDPARPFDTPSGLADPDAAAAMLAQAARETRAAYGAVSIPYGQVNRFRLGGLDLPGDGASGQLGAYRVMQFDPRPTDPVREAGRPDPAGDYRGFGDAWILLVHFTRPVSAQSVLAYGQSSRPGSPHASDQLALFAGHTLRPVWFHPAEIRANTRER